MDHKKTNIICTIGPASWDPQTLKRLAQHGMNVARLNMSHGKYEEKTDQIKQIRQIAEELDTPIAIMADLQGPKLRLGLIEGIKQIKKGDLIELSTDPEDQELPMQFDLSPFVEKGEKVYLNDGLVELEVLEVSGKTIKAKALNNGVVSSNKGCNVPETHLKGASFTDKDYHDAIFALEQKVDFLALSFVQTAKDLDQAKQLIKKYHPTTKIVVKIEKPQAIDNLEEIVKAADSVMVARGDLAIETDASLVPILQQKMIRLCRQYHKPVIVATQMLESMTENPRPTRAEVSDVANAVLDQVDAVMLSAESASGQYPVEAVETMRQIILSVEKYPDYARYFKIKWEELAKEELETNALVSSAASIAHRIKAKLIVVATASGYTARLLASFRPDANILAITHDTQTATQLSLVWGVSSLVIKPIKDTDTFWEHVLTAIQQEKLAQKGDNVVMISGSIVGQSGDTDSVKVATL